MIRIVFIIFLAISCGDQKPKLISDPKKTYNSIQGEDAAKPGAEKDGEKNGISQPGEAKPDTSEPLSPPIPISGSYLKCLETDSNSEISIDLACRFQNKEGQRISAKSIAKDVEYELPELMEPGVSVSIHETADEGELFDVHYIFTGDDFLSLRKIVAKVSLRVHFLKLLGTGKDAYLVAEGPSLFSSPPAPWWVRERSSDTNRDGQCQGGESCRFEGSGLLWLRDNGSIYGYVGAENLCAAYADEYSDWRLPTETELKIAFAKKIMALGSTSFLNLRSTRYWTSGDAPSNEKIAIDLESGVSLARDQADAFGVICVRALHELDGVL